MSSLLDDIPFDIILYDEKGISGINNGNYISIGTWDNNNIKKFLHYKSIISKCESSKYLWFMKNSDNKFTIILYVNSSESNYITIQELARWLEDRVLFDEIPLKKGDEIGIFNGTDQQVLQFLSIPSISSNISIISNDKLLNRINNKVDEPDVHYIDENTLKSRASISSSSASSSISSQISSPVSSSAITSSPIIGNNQVRKRLPRNEVADAFVSSLQQDNLKAQSSKIEKKALLFMIVIIMVILIIGYYLIKLGRLVSCLYSSVDCLQSQMKRLTGSY